MSHEQAVLFVKHMVNGFVAIREEKAKFQRINDKHLRGIKAEELLIGWRKN